MWRPTVANHTGSDTGRPSRRTVVRMPVWAVSSSTHASSSLRRTPMMKPSFPFRSDGALLPGPVGLAQAPLLDLAVGESGQDRDEVDAARALEARDALAAVLHELVGELRARVGAGGRFD